MSFSENFRLAFRGLTTNKIRTFLTMLGIIIGVGSVITLISVGRGVEHMVAGEFEGLGHNLLFVYPGEFNGSPLTRGGGLTNDDVAAISDVTAAPDLLYVLPEYGRTAVIIRSNQETRATVTGTTTDFPIVRDFYPISGNFFNEQDEVNASRVAVLGQTVYETLFPDGGQPVGEIIKINNINFTIIGLLEEKGGSGFNDQDDVILVPLDTAQRRLFPARRPDGKFRIDAISVQMIDASRQDSAIREVEIILRETHNIGLEDEDDFSVLSQDELLDSFAEITGMITLFLGVIAGISLLVGGIGIMNIMMVSVTERTREIGLRKALGAKRNAILWQFLVEAMTMSVIGGLIGLVLGVMGAFVISQLSDSLQPTVDWTAVMGSITISALIGLLFGVYPATRAASLNPIDALRYE